MFGCELVCCYREGLISKSFLIIKVSGFQMRRTDRNHCGKYNYRIYFLQKNVGEYEHKIIQQGTLQ